jgi:hypothetical protein
MIDSELINDIEVSSVKFEELLPRAKTSFLIDN